MSDSDSPLSSPPDSEDEVIPPSLLPDRPVKSPTPPSKKKQRKKEPPHVPTFADLPEIAFIVAFQSRFHAAFRGVPNLGPQDIEAGVINITPSEQVEQLLCRLLSLVLNRKKNVERGHHNRALEEAIQANQSQWPPQWEGRSPIAGGKKFDDLDAKQRLVLLRYLILWALSSSETIRAIISENYKLNRRNDDLNVGLSVQPWGRDGDKRRYWLIEGQEDTPFRLYRESNPALKNITWISVAGNIEEIKAVAADLESHGNKHSSEMARKIYQAIPRFEEGEVKRKRREYRQQRKKYFNLQAAAYSYEGRTRGKRIKYTFSDDSEGVSNEGSSANDGAGVRRSERTSRAASAVPEGPRFTASGRQIKRPTTGPYGEIRINGSHGTSTGAATPISPGSENGEAFAGHITRSRRGTARNTSYKMAIDGSEDEGSGSIGSRGDEDEYHDEGDIETDEDEMSVDDTVLEEDLVPKSLVVSLKYSPRRASSILLKEGDIMKSLPRPSFDGNPPVDSDAVMQDTSAVGTRSVQSEKEPLTKEATHAADGDVAVKELPVLESRPVLGDMATNGTSLAEIRSKGPDAG